MNSREAAALDRYITGNYGEDQFRSEANLDDEGDRDIEASNALDDLDDYLADSHPDGRRSQCKYCGEEIGAWEGQHFIHEEWRRTVRWMHAPDDGPDARQGCNCHCAECDPVGGYTDGRECIDGKMAEPA